MSIFLKFSLNCENIFIMTSFLIKGMSKLISQITPLSYLRAKLEDFFCVLKNEKNHQPYGLVAS